MTQYVLGFLFDDSASGVVLITKNRPRWQAGKLNGVGGHIEEGEQPLEAMIREFREETGVDYADWRQYHVLDFAGGNVYCFVGFSSEGALSIQSLTDEVVARYPVADLPDNVMPNLRWLIPMALDAEITLSRSFAGVPETPDATYRLVA